MAIQATSIMKKSFDAPDERREFALGHMDLVTVGGAPVGRMVFQPGWRWTESVKPLAGTPTCQTDHLGLMVRGRLHVRMDDGTEAEAGPGEVVVVRPGHDAWVVGDEPVEWIEFAGARTYATGAHVHAKPAAVTMMPETTEPHDLDPTPAEAALRADAGNVHLSRERMVALALRFVDLSNEQRGDAYDEVFATDVVDHDAFPGQAPGIQGFRDTLAQFAAGFPDLRAEAGEPMVDGDRVAFHLELTGTNTGPIMGIAPTGKAVRFGGMFIFRVVGGRVVDSWGTVDGINLLEQVGAGPWQKAPPAGGWPADEYV